MKTAIKSIFFVFFVVQLGFSQHGRECGTYDHEPIFERLRANKKAIAEGSSRSVETAYVPIKYHLVADNNGDGRIKVSAVLDQMCRLGREFADVDVVPYINDLFNNINNSNIYLNPINATGPMINRKDGASIDVFITENANATGAAGTVLGFYTPIGDYTVIRKFEALDSSGTLTHEIGHYLSLPHTHFPWAQPGYPFYAPSQFGNPISIEELVGTPAFQFPREEIELVDRSNCETAADEICDTPVDYCFPFAQEITANGCIWPHEVFDFNGDLIEPMANNTMGYFTDCDNYEFTPMQGEILKADFMSPARSHLRSGYVPNTNVITETPEIISPGQLEEVEFYNSVLFEWTAVEHAEHYLVEISGPDGTESYITEENILLVNNLEPDKTYFWLLMPFNETSTCIKINNLAFRTGNDITNVESIENEAALLQLYPNPILSGQDIRLNITSTKTFDAQVSLYNLAGKMVSTPKTISILKNQNTYNLSSDGLQPGVYLIKIKSENGILSQKLVIN